MLFAEWTASEWVTFFGAAGVFVTLLTGQVILIIKAVDNGRATTANAAKIDAVTGDVADVKHAMNHILDARVTAAEDTGAINERNRAAAAQSKAVLPPEAHL
jgi:hypothetical protein